MDVAHFPTADFVNATRRESIGYCGCEDLTRGRHDAVYGTGFAFIVRKR